MKQRLAWAAVMVCGLLSVGPAAAASGDRRPLSVKDEIAIAYFGDPNNGAAEPITISPDGGLAAVQTTRGLLAENRMADEVRIYDLARLKVWLKGPKSVAAPGPVRTFRLSTSEEGPVITDIRWLSGSRGIAFLAKTATANEQLWSADMTTGEQHALTPPDQNVWEYDIHDPEHFVYAIPNPSNGSRAVAAQFADHMPIWVANTDLFTLFDATDPSHETTRATLWAANGGATHAILDPASKKPIVLYHPVNTLRLSPDGRMVLTALPLRSVPAGWDKRYHTGFFANSNRVGSQDLSSDDGQEYVASYVLIDLSNGAQTKLGSHPTAYSEGWAAGTWRAPSWSADGSRLLLPGAFLSDLSDGPCFAVVSASDGRGECVMPVPANHYIEDVAGIGFEDRDNNRVWIKHCHAVSSVCRFDSFTKIHFQRTADGWHKVEETPDAADDATSDELGVRLSIRQTLNDPPVLWARIGNGGPARPLWDPNPQLRDVDLGLAKVVNWTDASGKSWTGGLFLPPNYSAGTRYPLVVQTHGFAPDQFRPSGAWPEGYAARELAGAGIVVLQVPDCPNVYSGDPDEASCHETMYKGAVEQLEKEGVVDPANVGLMGFSRTCIFVLDILGKRTFPVRAALAADGINNGYFQYVLFGAMGKLGRDMEKSIGAQPWGAGLQTWLQRSPGFNLDKVQAPLLLVAPKPGLGLLEMWEPYAMLTAMHKPVDLLMLNTDAHPTWQPAARYASQQGAVDWFRFWLQGYEEPDPAKAGQYARWRTLRSGQANDKK